MSTLEQKLTSFFTHAMEENNIPGIDCSVWHHHKELYRFQSGFADLESKTPIASDTLYNIYSNSKVITCAAALQLYERGEFLLEDRLDRFFPSMKNMKVRTPEGIRDAEKPITVRDLFCMTAGFSDGEGYGDAGMKFYQETGGSCPLVIFPDYLAQVPLFFEPGSEYRYGICHDVLGALIEKISGRPFGEYLKENIFKPLGMENTAFSLDGCRSKKLATQYRFQGADKELINVGAANCLVPPILRESGAGGLISTVDDYTRFQEALCTGDVILSKATINLMRLDQLEGKQREGYGYTNIGMGYGLGVRTTINQAKCGSPVGYGPFGWGGAAGTYGSIDPENDLSIFYAQHVFDNDPLRIHNCLRNIVYAGI